MSKNMNTRAVIWDYDGTLVDTRQKNLNVTKKIIEKISGKNSDEFPALQSIPNYQRANIKSANWRELYRNEFLLNDSQIDEAGKLWTEFQLADHTDVPFFPGIEKVIRHPGIKTQAIVSQNSKSNIVTKLKENNLLSFFNLIIGYEEVDIREQKPNPRGLLLCIDKLRISNPCTIFYVGDHETDVQCVINTKMHLEQQKSGWNILSIGALYGAENNADSWQAKPDYKAQNAADILQIIADHQ
ncbi:MAG: HAD family hydrolase [Calditrichaceae bacterium]